MSIARYFRSVSFLVLCSSLPAVWLACGGGSKPPETPADESSSSSASSEDGSAPSSAAADSAAPASDKPEKAEKSDKAESSATAEASPPPAPTFGSTDCGACIDKTCAKPEAACGKATDCQAFVDAIHACTSPGADACLSNATAPTAAKPKKLAAAVEACAKKAVTGKACKAKCQ